MSVNIKLKNQMGYPVTYSGVKKLSLKNTSDNDVAFTHNEGTKNVTANGTVSVDGYANASVNVQPTLQSKTATANGTVTPDSGYDGLSSVTVAIPTYDGSVM